MINSLIENFERLVNGLNLDKVYKINSEDVFLIENIEKNISNNLIFLFETEEDKDKFCYNVVCKNNENNKKYYVGSIWLSYDKIYSLYTINPSLKLKNKRIKNLGYNILKYTIKNMDSNRIEIINVLKDAKWFWINSLEKLKKEGIIINYKTTRIFDEVLYYKKIVLFKK